MVPRSCEKKLPPPLCITGGAPGSKPSDSAPVGPKSCPALQAARVSHNAALSAARYPRVFAAFHLQLALLRLQLAISLCGMEMLRPWNVRIATIVDALRCAISGAETQDTRQSR